MQQRLLIWRYLDRICFSIWTALHRKFFGLAITYMCMAWHGGLWALMIHVQRLDTPLLTRYHLPKGRT